MINYTEVQKGKEILLDLWFRLVMIRYIENIDTSFSISIYRIVSSKKYRIFQYIVIFFIYHDIFDISRYFTPEVYIFINALPK